MNYFSYNSRKTINRDKESIIIFKNKCSHDELYRVEADFADPIWCAKCNWNFDIDDFKISEELYRELISWVLDYQKSVDLFKAPALPEDKKVKHNEKGTLLAKKVQIELGVPVIFNPLT
ncbi:hypothetical protein [Bacillus sp. AFS029533]|uniref:hypothetical protein n=1 Tax=Bacillus sp. AFS029533 TaxID=2033494 RepID=UPI000BFC42CA|nr:hypothetical protein [Bacillus sp. AFS029533]PGZ90449.1 hypothetical protein COE53_17925 [Bacillus sp. AFS029533]